MTELVPNMIDLDADDRMERPVNRLCNLALKDAILAGVRQIRMPTPDEAFGLVEYFADGAWKTVMKAAWKPMVVRYESIVGTAGSRVKVQERVYPIMLTKQAVASGGAEVTLEIGTAT